MTDDKKQKEKIFSLIVLIMIIIILILMGIYAWAKFTSRVSENAIGQTAKWHFELKEGVSQTSGKQLLALTRTDNNTNVLAGKIAPGTFGEFLIEIDTSGTEVALVYDIDINIANCPQNLKFYTKSDYSQELVNDNGKLQIQKYLSLENMNQVHLETIYWKWEYETGLTDEDKNGNDAIDTLDQGKTISFEIKAKGVQSN